MDQIEWVRDRGDNRFRFRLETFRPSPRGGHALPFYTLKRRYGRFRGGPPAERASCGPLLPLWTLNAVRL
jgi:hypothetical protein